MRFRTTLLLLLVLAGLGGYVYWVEYPKAQEKDKKQKLYEFKTDEATEVDLVFADRELVLKKSGDDWRLTKPLDAPADAVTVKNLVGAIADCEIKKELTETSSDLATYGLDKPFVTLTVKLKDKALAAVAVGKTTPIGSSAYVQKADDKKILLANGAFRSGLDKQVKDLRDKTIVAFSDDELQRVEISGEDKDIVLVKKDGNWALERPAAYGADTANVRSFLSSLRALRANDFPEEVPTDLSTYGLDAPRLAIRLLIGKDNVEKRILFGSKETDKKEPYVQTSGVSTVYTVSEFSLKDLNKNVADFRDKTLLTFDRDSATGIDVERKDGSRFKLVRGDDKQWHADGVEGKAATSIANQYIGDVHDLKGYEIAADNPTDLAEFGLDQPLLTIRVSGAEQKPIGIVRIAEKLAADGKKEFAAMAEGGQTVFRVRDYTVTRLNKQAKDFIEAPTPTPGGATPTVMPAEIPEMGFGDEGLGGEDSGDDE